MAFDTFVQINGIAGESKDNNHNEWIEALSFGAGASQKVSATVSSAGGATVERADIKPFMFTKYVDASSPKLFQACAAGTRFDKVTIEICRAGGDEKVNYLKYELSDCIICDIATNGGGEAFPTEIVSLNFSKIAITYVKQRREGGGPAGNISAGWDLRRKCKV